MTIDCDHSNEEYVANNNGTHSQSCSKCGEVELSDCSYSALVTKPTCSETGYTTYTCENCHYSYNADYVDCVKHSFKNYVSDNNTTSKKDGTKTAYCDYGCSTTDIIIDKASTISSSPVKKPTVSKVKSFKAKAGKKNLKLSWKKLSDVAGYQLQISTKKNFKEAKTISISKSKKTYTKKKLTAKKKYYIRIRAYKTYKDANKKTK